MVAIKSHFDGRAFVPDEPVRLQSGQVVILHVELSPAEERSSEAGHAGSRTTGGDTHMRGTTAKRDG